MMSGHFLSKQSIYIVWCVLFSGLVCNTLFIAPSRSTFAEKVTQTTSASQSEEPNEQSYTFNEATGSWSNGQYRWDPSNGQTTNISDIEQDSTYDANTGRWNTSEYIYDGTSQSYIPTATPTQTDASDNNQQNQSRLANPPETSAQTSEQVASTAASNTELLHHFLSNAQSGNILAGSNTAVGSLSSGDAQTLVTLLNSLNSNWSGLQNKGSLSVFNSNITDDVNGDILINPAAIFQPSSAQTLNSANSTTPILNNSSDTSIANNVTLSAVSGNVNANSNTQVGDLTSGNALAMVNLINLLNSTISAGQSFLGTLNIYGNLQGDILLPSNFIPQSIIPNLASSTSNSFAGQNNTALITNDIDQNSTSGNIHANANTTVGTSQSGGATNQQHVMNIVNTGLQGTDSLLVFVNVFGQWHGLIVNAFPDSHTALLASGLAQPSAQLFGANGAANTTSTITNNIDLNAKSGDVTATNNTNVGNLKSGSAKTAVNILNINSSNLSLSNWFGILFINVFGKWDGSFGVDTLAGNPGNPTSTLPATSGSHNTNDVAAQQVFSFRPSNFTSGSETTNSPNEAAPATTSRTDQNNNSSPNVLGTTDDSSTPTSLTGSELAEKRQKGLNTQTLGLILTGLSVSALLVLIEQVLGRLKKPAAI